MSFIFLWEKHINKKAIALTLTVGVLGLISLLVTSFCLTIYWQTKQAEHHLSLAKAEFFVEAAFSHGQMVLKKDKNETTFDWEKDRWRTEFEEEEGVEGVDNDGDGVADSKWIYFQDDRGNDIGRYAVLIRDESSKININTAGGKCRKDFLGHCQGQGFSTYEISLEDFFECSKLSPADAAEKLTGRILTERYGLDGRPGGIGDDNLNNPILKSDGIDNDADGDIDEKDEGIDEPQEFNPYHPKGDDTPVDRPFLSIRQVRPLMPDSKTDPKTDNFKRIADQITCFSFEREISREIVSGENQEFLRLNINTSSTDELAVLFRGAGISDPEQKAVNVVDFRDKDFAASLICDDKGKFYYGVEGIRINEIMVKPILKLDTTKDQNPGGGWIWEGDQNYYYCESASQDYGEWKWSDLPPGSYRLILYGKENERIGDVVANGTSQENIVHGQRLKEIVTINEDGKFTLKIRNNKENTTTYFKYLELSQQPDVEYIELVNLTNKEVDLGGWQIETNFFPPATIPKGTSIRRKDDKEENYLVLTVDKKDTCPKIPKIAGDGISFINVWKGISEEKICQLDFKNKELNPDDDFLYDGGDTLTLKDENGEIVEEVEYFSGDIPEDILSGNISSSYRALEKGDPVCLSDGDNNSIYDGWFRSENIHRGTPAYKNKNSEIDSLQSLPVIANHDFVSCGYLLDVPTSKKSGEKFSVEDLAKIIDKITTSSLMLQAEIKECKKSENDGWKLEERKPLQTDWFVSRTSGSEGTWEWTARDGIEDGVYYLYLAGKKGEKILVTWNEKDEQGNTIERKLLSTFRDDNLASLGPIHITGRKLLLKIKHPSSSDLEAGETPIPTSHFDYILLTPAPFSYTFGCININTASDCVLMSLPDITKDEIKNIREKRPYSNIAQLLTKGIITKERFKKWANLITVRSDVYEIIITASSGRRKGEIWISSATIRSKIIIER